MSGPSPEALNRVATEAMKQVQPGMRLGLGTGRAAEAFIRLLGAAVHGGLSVECITTSIRSQKLADELAIPTGTLATIETLDVAFDGADEVTPQLELTKEFIAFDENSDGCLDFEEFRHACGAPAGESLEECRKLFELLDEDDGGAFLSNSMPLEEVTFSLAPIATASSRVRGSASPGEGPRHCAARRSRLRNPDAEGLWR